MTLRQLRYFVTLAEELHFTRAAQRLHLAQSALSTQIRSLEDEVGAPLFDRANRRVALTPAGDTLLAGARTLLADADVLLTRTRAVAAQQDEVLAIGCLGPVPGDLLGEILDELRRARPAADVEMHVFGFAEILPSLRERRVDVAFVYLPFSDDELADLEILPLRREPRCVALASSHPLAGRPFLTPADLADETFVTSTEAVSATWRDFWLLTEELGRRPAVHRRATDSIEEWLHLIRGAAGIDTCPAIVAEYYRWPGLSFVPLRDAEPVTLALGRHAERRGPAVDDLVAIAVRAAQRSPVT